MLRLPGLAQLPNASPVAVLNHLASSNKATSPLGMDTFFFYMSSARSGIVWDSKQELMM